MRAIPAAIVPSCKSVLLSSGSFPSWEGRRVETRAAGENWKEKAVGSGRNARSKLHHNMAVRRNEGTNGRVILV